jgi:putative phosphoesterase
VGVIADTHGLLRPEARSFLRGSDYIVHAGDIGDRGILDELRGIAPVSVVRGNNDSEPWAAQLPETEMLHAGEVCIYVVHNLVELHLEPAAAGVQVIVSGHSHKPMLELRAGMLFMNPGSAGPRRFRLPIAVGELLIDGRGVVARVVDLTTSSPCATLTGTL